MWRVRLPRFFLAASLTLGCARVGYDLTTLGSAHAGSGGTSNAAGAPDLPTAGGFGGAGFGGASGSDNLGAASSAAGLGNIAGTGGAAGAGFVQRVAVPAYFTNQTTWSQLVAGAPVVSIVIINPNSGSGSSRDETIAAQSADARANGISTLGYVRTDYATREISVLQAEVDNYFAWYEVSGIFLDQSTFDCTEEPYYRSMYDYIKGQEPSAIVALSPGRTVDECFMGVSDVLVTFQDTPALYDTFVPAAWEAKYPASRFWHLIHSTPRAEMPQVVERSKQLRAGFVYVTSDVLPNPWDTLPGLSYWTEELLQVGL